jgi:hypothetical protein
MDGFPFHSIDTRCPLIEKLKVRASGIFAQPIEPMSDDQRAGIIRRYLFVSCSTLSSFRKFDSRSLAPRNSELRKSSRSEMPPDYEAVHHPA